MTPRSESSVEAGEGHALVPLDRPARGPATEPAPGDALPPFARRAAGSVAVALGLLLLATSGRYGFQGDELYFLGAGTHGGWSYADNPALMPWTAHLLSWVSDGSLVVLRLPATLLMAGNVLLIALLARELGGAARAQTFAALAFAVTPLTMIAGHTLSATTVDVVAWTATIWALVAWVRRRDDRVLLVAVVSTAVAMQAKYSIVFLWVAVVLAVLAFGPRRLLLRPPLLVGGLVVAATLVPGLLWQADHGWPQLAMTGVFAAEGAGPVGFLTGLIYLAGILLAVPMAVGLWSLLRREEMRPHRYLGVAFVLLLVLFLLQGGRPNYLAGFFGLLWAAGAVALQTHGGARWWRWTTSWVVLALVAVLSITLHLPVTPQSMAPRAAGTPNNPQAAETVGWPALVETVRRAYDAVPPGDRASTVILAQYYTSAGALDYFGPDAGLPPVHSTHRGYWYFGPPPDTTTTTLYVGTDPGQVRAVYADVREIGRTPPGPDAVAGIPVYLCTGPRQPWSAVWPSFGHLL